MYQSFIEQLHTRAQENDWVLEESNPLEFYYSYDQVDRDLEVGGLHHAIPDAETVFYSSEYSPVDDWGSTDNTYLIDLGDILIEAVHYCPEYCDDEGDTRLTLTRVSTNSNKQQAIDDYKASYAKGSLNFIKTNTSLSETDWITAFQASAETALVAYDPMKDISGFPSALSRMAYACRDLASKAQFALIQSRMPVGCNGLSWSLDHVMSDDGRTSLDISPVILHFNSPECGEIQLNIYNEEYELDCLDNEELSYLTELPITDNQRRETVLEHFANNQSELFDIDPFEVFEAAYILATDKQVDNYTFTTPGSTDLQKDAA